MLALLLRLATIKMGCSLAEAKVLPTTSKGAAILSAPYSSRG